MGGISSKRGAIEQPIKVIVGLNAAVYFVHAAPLLSDRYFDITGSCAFAAATIVGWINGRRRRNRSKSSIDDRESSQPTSSTDMRSLRSTLASGALLAWCTRLGLFLLSRVTRDGKDRRQDAMKAGRLKFAIPWIIQSIWCTLVGMPTYLTNRYATADSLDVVDCGSLGMWLLGFVLEVVSDSQKKRFAEAGLRDSTGFISSGLWSWSRHPNYVGEILLWLGLAIFGCNSTQRHPKCSLPLASFLSPLFTYLLLGYVTGVPLLEKRAMKKWGSRSDYKAYVARTPVLFPRTLSATVVAFLVAAVLYMRRKSKAHGEKVGAVRMISTARHVGPQSISPRER